MVRIAFAAAALIVSAASLAQVPQTAPPAADPVVVTDAADTARIKAGVVDDVSAQTSKIRQSQDDYARAQSAFAQAQAAYEDAKRRNDAERAEAAANAAAYQRDLATWKTKVAEVDTHNARLRTGSAGKPSAKDAKPEPPRLVCTMEAPTGSNMPKRVCRSSDGTSAR